MFKKETLFILGAGASLPYGYPIGKQLIKDIIKNRNDDIFLPVIDGEKYDYNDNNQVYHFDVFTSELTRQINDGTIKTFKSIPYPGKENRFISNPPNSTVYFKTKISKIKKFQELAQALLNFDPVSIDSFLRDNPSHV